MPSFEPRSGRRWLEWAITAAIGFALAVLATTWLVDPFGLIRTNAGGICAPGIKSGRHPNLKLLVVAVHRPQAILLGSSRVQGGFDAHAFDAEGQTTANLGRNGASLAEIDWLTRQSLERTALRRVWIGLDFGTFVQPIDAPRFDALPQLGPTELAWRAGVVDAQAVRAAVEGLVTDECTAPRLTTLGFHSDRMRGLLATATVASTSARARAQLDRSWQAREGARTRQYSASIGRIDTLARDLKAANVALVLFLSPVSPDYADSIAKAGLSARYAEWRQTMIALAARHGATLIQSDRAAFLNAAAARCPPTTDAVSCVFYDALHYRPIVGDAIVAAAARRTDGPSNPGPAVNRN